jgi:ketosteroid isomerase-like protein
MQEEPMEFTRRHLGLAAGLLLAAASLPIGVGVAQSGDEAAVNAAVEALRKAMLAADKAGLEALVSDKLSYGHSGGVIESKAQFVEVIVSKKTVYKTITLSEPSATVAGNNAIVRHIFSAETESGGKAGSARVGVLQVWQKDGGWKLLARQAFRFPT